MNILRNHRGITLLETVIVLIIGGLIISGIWVAYAQVSMTDRINRTVIAIDKTAAVARDFMITRSKIPDDISIQLKDLMPSELKFVLIQNSNAIFLSPLGDSFSIYPYSAAPPFDTSVLQIRVAYTPKTTECVKLVPAIVGSQKTMQDRGIIGYEVGTKVSPPNLTGVVPTPPTPQELPTLCSADGDNALRIYFAVRP